MDHDDRPRRPLVVTPPPKLADLETRIEADKVQGSEGELRVEKEITSGDVVPELGSSAKLRGSQVRIRTEVGAQHGFGVPRKP